jgi:acetyl/propionyl-CoA carboxylase alpha subunit
MTRPIRRLLIANRGEIAARIARTARSLGIETVGVASDADLYAAHTRVVDRLVRLGGDSASSSYLRIDAVVAAAVASGADAVHPGYGFLSESADFARAVIAAGMVWVGPPPEAMEALGGKASARQVAASLGVPVVPGFDQSDDLHALREAAQRIGVPLMIKASAGGGGRGMRRVDALSGLDEAFASARREAEASFGDGRLLIERYVERPRHVEVQVLADAYGGVWTLGERDCSVQRRHQKIVEEAPSPAVSPALREQLQAAAATLARHVGYRGAGTFEFLLSGDAFYFLELNARLQVEHPVTEAVTGTDLVALQIAVAEGVRLETLGAAPSLSGHAVEVRLCAEDPSRDDRPSAGMLSRVVWPEGEGIRVDTGFFEGDVVTPHYDAMLAKIIAFGPTRPLAIRRLRAALGRTIVLGLPTNLPLLRAIVDDAAFAAGDVDTGFLVHRDLRAQLPPPSSLLAALAAAWDLHRQRPSIGPGFSFRLHGPATLTDRWASADGTSIEVALTPSADGYTARSADRRWFLAPRGEGRWEVDGVVGPLNVVAPDLGEDGLFSVAWSGDFGAWSRLPRFPEPEAVTDAGGGSVAPMPGVVRALPVAVGEAVSAGATVAVVEAMKMEHAVSAPHDGVVEAVLVAVGDAVAEGQLLVRVDMRAAAP